MEKDAKLDAWIGIDPGKSGACVCIVENGEIDFCDYSNPSDAADFLAVKNNRYRIRLAALESVHAMPGQGVSSTFKFGHNAGVWEGILATLLIPTEKPTPRKWQKGLFAKSDGDNKERSRNVALRLYPVVPFLKRKRDHNRADALLLARWAQEQTRGRNEL